MIREVGPEPVQNYATNAKPRTQDNLRVCHGQSYQMLPIGQAAQQQWPHL